jgi:hypothetical protein
MVLAANANQSNRALSQQRGNYRVDSCHDLPREKACPNRRQHDSYAKHEDWEPSDKMTPASEGPLGLSYLCPISQLIGQTGTST